MTYYDLCKMIHLDFLEAVRKRNITKEKFLEKIGTCETNGCCYYKGTKFASIQKISVMCNQLGIPFEEVSPYYAERFKKTEDAAENREIH